ncbi:hypothetical protein PR202_gb00131 [Eleusine coracana subsp. coracana]|uniref:Pectate lyase domain-containing protein n=1 Tax=Eleusine coracana subsp. coracana TaxID=191504 RepID=A0AAV5DT50_ELECO|nr:hypothetical protein PR202_gb00131 [Eleusine coracana subsp. coracana]
MATPPPSEPTMEDAKSLFHDGPARSARDAAVPNRYGSYSTCPARSTSPPRRARLVVQDDRRPRAAHQTFREGPASAGGEHVIVCCLEIAGGRATTRTRCRSSPGPGTCGWTGAACATAPDGLLDVTNGSTDVTVSRCHLAAHDKAVLIGGSSAHVEDRCVQGHHPPLLLRRHQAEAPARQFGRVHLYNNYTRDWGIYAVCASIISQCNIYKAGKKKEVFRYMEEQLTPFLLAEAEQIGRAESECMSQVPTPYDVHGGCGLRLCTTTTLLQVHHLRYAIVDSRA